MHNLTQTLKLMKKRYWLIGICIIIILFCLKLNMNKDIVKCPEFNKAYSEWFPYNKGDILNFKNSDSIREYIVSTYNINKTKSYNRNMKCGCCEDGIVIYLTAKRDTIKIDFENFINPNSCMGSRRFISRNGKSINVKATQNQKELDLNQISSDSLIIEKNIGIKQIIWNGKLYEFESIKKSKTDNKIILNSRC